MGRRWQFFPYDPLSRDRSKSCLRAIDGATDGQNGLSVATVRDRSLYGVGGASMSHRWMIDGIDGHRWIDGAEQLYTATDGRQDGRRGGCGCVLFWLQLCAISPRTI